MIVRCAFVLLVEHELRRVRVRAAHGAQRSAAHSGRGHREARAARRRADGRDRLHSTRRPGPALSSRMGRLFNHMNILLVFTYKLNNAFIIDIIFIN